jgi:tetratricopeptide (TPR) repeat protein
MSGLLAGLLSFAVGAWAQPGPAERRAGYKQWDAGVALVLAGEVGKAGEAWEDCLRLDPENPDCRAGLKLLELSPAAVEAPPGVKPVAVRHADPETARAEAAPKRNAVRHWNAGIISFQQGDYPKALAEWRLCVVMDEMNEDCRSGIKRAEGLLPPPKRSASAAKVEARGLKEPGVQKATEHWNAGILHYQKGDLEKARREWTLCRSSDPLNMDCHTGLLRIARQYGEK